MQIARSPNSPALTRIEMVVNRKTAKTLGLAVPPSILLRADEVIE
jgi:putative ABC transport system substrate-binding protein